MFSIACFFVKSVGGHWWVKHAHLGNVVFPRESILLGTFGRLFSVSSECGFKFFLGLQGNKTLKDLNISFSDNKWLPIKLVMLQNSQNLLVLAQHPWRRFWLHWERWWTTWCHFVATPKCQQLVNTANLDTPQHCQLGHSTRAWKIEPLPVWNWAHWGGFEACLSCGGGRIRKLNPYLSETVKVVLRHAHRAGEEESDFGLLPTWKKEVRAQEYTLQSNWSYAVRTPPSKEQHGSDQNIKAMAAQNNCTVRSRTP